MHASEYCTSGSCILCVHPRFGYLVHIVSVSEKPQVSFMLEMDLEVCPESSYYYYWLSGALVRVSEYWLSGACCACICVWINGGYCVCLCIIKKYRWYHPWQKQRCIGGTMVALLWTIRDSGTVHGVSLGHALIHSIDLLKTHPSWIVYPLATHRCCASYIPTLQLSIFFKWPRITHLSSASGC